MNAIRAMAPRPMPASVDARARLIVALDVPSVAQAKLLVQRLKGTVSTFKIGPWLNMEIGFEALVSDLIASDCSVFMDMKGQDIPETMRAQADSSARRGVRFLTVHGNGEVPDEAMRAAVSAKGSMKIFTVTVLTSLDQGDLNQTGYGELNNVVAERTEKALRCGCDGVIASAREARFVKQLAATHGRSGFLVVTPGIRPEGASRDDHKRAATPSFAIREGADYLVVGRPIIQSVDAAAATKAIIAEMQDAFDQRIAAQ